MCTLSWWRKSHSYGVLFNRDESRKRLAAQLPSRYEDNSIGYLSPLDPDGGGTWIWVNEVGVISCLLNNYSVKNGSPDNPISRGLLLKSLASCGGLESIIAAVSDAELGEYMGFLLFSMDGYGCSLMIWDRDTLHISRDSRLKKPITSSGYLREEIISYRQSLYASKFAMIDSPSPEELFCYHTCHDPSLPAHSVLMCRPDARTVSLSRIIVDDETVHFSYGAVSEHCHLDTPITSLMKRAH